MERLTRWPEPVAVVDLGQAAGHLDLLAVGLVVMSQKVSASAVVCHEHGTTC